MLSLLMRYETWLILGLVLIVLDIALGLDFFALSFGIGGLVTGLGILIFADADLFQTWESTVTTFGIASVVILFPLRRWVLKTTRETDDINNY